MKFQHSKLILIKIEQLFAKIYENHDDFANIGSELAGTKCFEIAQKGASLNLTSHQEPALSRLLHGGSSLEALA